MPLSSSTATAFLASFSFFYLKQFNSILHCAEQGFNHRYAGKNTLAEQNDPVKQIRINQNANRR